MTGNPPRSLIGQALVDEEIIDENQLDRALKIQAHLEQPRQLGEILVELGYTTRQAITEVVAKYGKQMRIGDILVEQGILTSEQLTTALKVKKEQGKPVGQVLVELGFINERTLLQNLAHQAQVPYIEPNFAMIDRDLLAGVSVDWLKKNNFIPFCRTDDNKTLVVVSDLRDSETISAIEDVYREDYSLALGPKDTIEKTIHALHSLSGESRSTETRTEDSEEDSIIQLVRHIVEQAIDENASDVHIEPMADRIRLRYRLDGVLVFKSDLPKSLLNKTISRIKIMADCDISEQRRHQGGRILFETAGTEYDLRLSCYVTVHGECAVLRILNKQMGLSGLDELGMCPSMLERFRTDVLEPPTGVVVITGPTGSGKTTTLYSSLDYCNDINTKIITVEDPVEFLIDGVIQCSVHEKIGRSFEDTLREMVRQDPDIIVLGEIRDKITAETAIQAALTGHKVYSTFHTEDTIGGLMRLLNMEIEAFLITSTVISVVAQRLLRRICPDCALPHNPNPEVIRKLGLDMKEVSEFEYLHGQGCDNCNFTGYRGRIAVYEMLVVNEDVKDAILLGKPAHTIRRISADTTGLISIREDAITKVVRGKSTFEEVLKHTPKSFEPRTLPELMALTQ